jgi:hypothetical protein
MSNPAPQCQHIKMNGSRCGSSAAKGRRYCHFHKEAHLQKARINNDVQGVKPFQVPILEDAHSVQLGLMQVMHMLATRSLDHKTAGMMLYALQTASINLRRPEFKAVDPQEQKEREALEALITLGKHLKEPVPEYMQEDLDRWKNATQDAEASRAAHPGQARMQDERRALEEERGGLENQGDRGMAP